MVAGFQDAPFWAQIAMAFFAFTAVVMVAGPHVTKWKYRRHFDSIARGLGQAPATSSPWPLRFPVVSSDRPFELRYDVRRPSSKGSSYRGPHGYLLIAASRLAGTGGSTCQVDITPVDKRLSRLVRGNRTTGDADFDRRFIVTQDGSPAGVGWLDGSTRQDIARFFDQVPRPSLLWIRQGELQCIMQHPWTGIDGQVMRGLLERQAVLASALERAARNP